MSFKRKIRRAIKASRPPKMSSEVKSKVEELLAKKRQGAATLPKPDGMEAT